MFQDFNDPAGLVVQLEQCAFNVDRYQAIIAQWHNHSAAGIDIIIKNIAPVIALLPTRRQRFTPGGFLLQSRGQIFMVFILLGQNGRTGQQGTQADCYLGFR